MGRRTWQAMVQKATKSWTRLSNRAHTHKIVSVMLTATQKVMTCPKGTDLCQICEAQEPFPSINYTLKSRICDQISNSKGKGENIEQDNRSEERRGEDRKESSMLKEVYERSSRKLVTPLVPSTTVASGD